MNGIYGRNLFMTWNERRIITVLGIILGLLCAVLLVVLGLRYREVRDVEEPAAPVLPGKVEEEEEPISPFSALTYFNGETTLSFSLTETGSWVWSDDPEFPLDTTTLTAILEILSSWDPQQTITDPEVIANSGVGFPTGTLEASAQTGVLSLTFGKTTTDGKSYYVQLNDDESTVYILDGRIRELMDVAIYDMCILPELPHLTEDVIQSVLFRGATAEDGTLGISSSLTAQRPEGQLTGTPSWRAAGANVTSAPLIRNLLEDLEKLQFDRCVIYRPSEEAASICGFDRPALVYVSYVTAEGEDAMLELQIGAQLPDGSGRYVRLGTEPIVYFLPTELLDPLMMICTNGLEG